MLRYSLALLALCAPAAADTPRVAVDIPPLHSLVAQVMEGVGTPDLVLPPGLSPHDMALRPSDAQALASADLVVWTGPELSPAIARAVEALTSGQVLALLDVPDTVILEFREGTVFEDHEHGDEHGEDHGEHDDHGEHAEHGEHDDHEAHADVHDHDGRDPHAWLDPVNAALWLTAISQALMEIDPENSETYSQNAEVAIQRVAALQAEIDIRLQPLRGQPFVVFHDAYHYFEARFEVEAAGAISLGDGSTPGPRRLAEITGAIADLGVRCVFAEPQFNAGLVEIAVADAGARIGVIDPLGVSLEPGVELYGELMSAMAGSFETCLAPQ